MNEAIQLMVGETVTHASLDHDLGEFNEDGGERYRLVLWMAEHDRWPTEGIRIRSAVSAWLYAWAGRLEFGRSRVPDPAGGGQFVEGARQRAVEFSRRREWVLWRL